MPNPSTHAGFIIEALNSFAISGVFEVVSFALTAVALITATAYALGVIGQEMRDGF